jgi:hypothetical protein
VAYAKKIAVWPLNRRWRYPKEVVPRGSGNIFSVSTSRFVPTLTSSPQIAFYLPDTACHPPHPRASPDRALDSRKFVVTH